MNREVKTMNVINKLHMQLMDVNSIYGSELSEAIFTETEEICGDFTTLEVGRTYDLKKNADDVSSIPFKMSVYEATDVFIKLKFSSCRVWENELELFPEWKIVVYPSLRLGDAISFIDKFNSNNIGVTIEPKYMDNYQIQLAEPTSIFQTFRKELNSSLLEELISIKNIGLRLTK